jgi:hypothetical protein
MIALVLAVIAHAHTTLRITEVELTEGGLTRPVALPFSAVTTVREPVEFRGHLYGGLLGPRSIVIVPDDQFLSLSINGVDVPLGAVSPAQLEDYRRGFTLQIGSYVRAGDNVVLALVRNRGGPGGLDLRADPFEWTTVVELAIGLAGLLALIGDVLRGFGLRWPLVAVLLASLVVRFAYLSATPYDVRCHDPDQHLEYVDYLLDHHRLPPANQGFMFYHPPLYYLVSALQWAGLRSAGQTTSFILRSLQVQSMLFELGFALLSIAAVRLWLRRVPPSGFQRGLGSDAALNAQLAALILVWPASIVHAARIGNDDLMYLLFAGSFFFTSRWWLDGADRDLRWAALLAAFGVVTKTNGLIAFAVLLFAFVARLAIVERGHRVGAYFRRGWVAASLLAVSVAAALGAATRDWLSGDRTHLLIASADHSPPALIVGNYAKNYLWFDAWNFVTQPFTSAWDDAMGRQWFWNYAMKTSLFGEFTYSRPWLWDIGIVMSILLLLMMLQLLMGALIVPRSDWLLELPLTVAAAVWVVSLAALRIRFPKSCHNDFRLILPVIVPCAYAYVRTQTRCRERGWRWVATANAATGWVFVAACAAFFGVVSIVED